MKRGRLIGSRQTRDMNEWRLGVTFFPEYEVSG